MIDIDNGDGMKIIYRLINSVWGACEYCWDNPCTCDNDWDDDM